MLNRQNLDNTESGHDRQSILDDTLNRFFFTQVKIGKKGKEIKVWKLKTMRDGQPNGGVFATRDRIAGSQPDKDRITSIGALLRLSLLDEIPQFLNWLRGDLNLTGFRPFLPEVLDHFPEDIREFVLTNEDAIGLFPMDLAMGRFNGDLELRYKYMRQYMVIVRDLRANPNLLKELTVKINLISNAILNRWTDPAYIKIIRDRVATDISRTIALFC